MKTLYVATQNAHKLQEFEAMLKPLNFIVKGTTGIDFECIEDGQTFEANAEKKAEALARCLGDNFEGYIVADDSGLEVDALGGDPGIFSARYAGVEGSNRDVANNQKLLAALENTPNDERGARFVCVLALRHSGGLLRCFRGTMEGSIARAPRGTNGFGYDPLMWLAPLKKCVAELRAEQKHERSHRGQALKELVAFLEEG